MAGKFMSPEEAARLLGVTVDEVNRLVDRKKLFPMRDGATIKFKTDDVERLVRTLGEESSSQADELELDMPELTIDDAGPVGPSADEDALVLDDGAESIFGTAPDRGASPSDTGVGGPARAGSGSGKGDSGLSLSSPGLAGGDDLVLDAAVLGDDPGSDDLSLESIVGASSPSLGGGAAGGSGSGSLAIELSDIGGPGSAVGSGKAKSGSGIGGLSGPGLSGPGLSGPGLGGLSGGLGSGVSLGDGLADSGVDLGSAASAAKAAGDDDFELGGGTVDDESASVVIASDSEAGDSSFFGQTIGGQSSSFADDSSLGSTGSSEALAFPTAALEEVNFSVWQVVGLICCSLLLLFGGFIAYDLVRTIGSPENTSLSNPILNSLAEVFGWR